MYGRWKKLQTSCKDKVLGKFQTSGIGIESLDETASAMMQAVPGEREFSGYSIPTPKCSNETPYNSLDCRSESPRGMVVDVLLFLHLNLPKASTSIVLI